MNTLSQFAKERVDIIVQEEETKDYFISLKEGYVFKGRYFQGDMRGYGLMKCRTVAEVKKSVRKNSIQKGVSFKQGQEDLEQEYHKILKEEEKSWDETLEKMTEDLKSEERQKQLKEMINEVFEKSKEKMASPEWQEEIRKQAWNNVLKELNATIQYAGKEETYKRYFSVIKDEEFEKRSLQAREILDDQKREGRKLVDWIIPYVLDSKDGFLVQLKEGIENPLFIQNATELKATLERLV